MKGCSVNWLILAISLFIQLHPLNAAPFVTPSVNVQVSRNFPWVNAPIPFANPTLRSLRPVVSGAEDTLVDPYSQISDEGARFALVKILVNKRENADEALHHLQILLKTKAEDPELLLMLARVYVHKKEFGEANAIAKRVLALDSKEVAITRDLAFLEASLGHPVLSRCLFEKTFSMIKEPEKWLNIGYAGILQSWGEFRQAKKIFLHYIQEKPDDVDVWLLYAFLLTSEQRYIEAEQVYWELLCKKYEPRILLDLVRVKFYLKDYAAAYALIQHVDPPEKLLRDSDYLQAQVLEKLEEYELAALYYEKAAKESKLPSDAAEALVQALDCFIKLGNPEQAERLLAEALQLDPKSIPVRYAAAKLEQEPCLDFSTVTTAQELVAWADLYLEDQAVNSSIELLQQALCLDPEFLSARLQLAELYPIQFDYVESQQLYLDLLDDFPDNPKYLLGYARALSWNKQYEASIFIYDRLICSDPNNPLYGLEKARVTLWWQAGDRAFAMYEEFLSPSVDELVLLAVQQERSSDPELLHLREILERHISQGDLYGGYEEALDYFQPKEKALCGHSGTCVDCLLLDFFAEYVIQKAVYLEMEANRAVWNTRYLKALCYFQALIDFQPGSEEALFNYSQDWCTLGMCERTRCLYWRIRQLDPLHSIVNLGLERRAILDSPSVFTGYNYWREAGRGGLSGITRHLITAGWKYPIDCQSYYKIYTETHINRTDIHERYFVANGLGVEYKNVINPYLTTTLMLSRKLDGNYRFRNPWLANAHINVRFNDYLQGEFGYLRKDEFYNYFGVKRGVQSNTFWARGIWTPTRKLNIDGSYLYLRYTDHNHQDIGLLSTTYRFTEYPKILKASLQGEYRNTARLSEFIYASNGTTILDIIRPYWTPQNYYAGRFVVEWFHDLSKFEFCEAEKSYYSAKWMVGTDTEDNPGTSVTFEWHHDWNNRWSFQLSALLHRSRQWNAEGIWTNLSYYY